MSHNLLTLDSLSIAFDPKKPVVKNLSLELKQGECLAIVGQSGSGKTLTALSIPQLLPSNAQVSQNSRILFYGDDLLKKTQRQMEAKRGYGIGMIFQDAMSAFNPVKTIGEQINEMRYLHALQNRNQRRQNCLDSLESVGLYDPERVYNSYPHQLSGGMKQRAMIALALSHNPQLLIADEPTTALDVTVQKQVLTLLKELQQKHGFGILFISHDLSVVSQVADHVAVMKDGVCLEQAPAQEFFHAPKSDYAKELKKAVLPSKAVAKAEITTDNLMRIDQLSVQFKQARVGFRRSPPLVVLKDIHLTVRQGETVALIGESGSGKTTLAKTVVELVEKSSGQIQYPAGDTNVQMVFQDPYAAFNPRRRMGDSLLEAIKKTFPKLTLQQRLDKMQVLLNKVSIDPKRCWDYPHEFSGGEQQRIAVARALACDAKLLILDEPTSAMDVSNQLQTLDLLAQLQQETGISYLLITHHMSVVAKLAHRVAVMKDGEIVEQGETQTVLDSPRHSYTRELLGAILTLD